MNATGDHNGNGNINNPNFGTSDDKAHRLAYLIAGFLKQTLTTAEHDELDEWVNTSKENMQLFERLSDESNLGELEKRIADKDVETARYKIKQKIGFTKLNRTDYKPILRTIAIAASILIAVGLLFLYNYRDEELETSETSMIAEDVAPGNYLATLQLSDGKKIILDSNQKGRIAGEGSVAIDLSKDGLEYADSGSTSNLKMNTISVPEKAHFKVVLSDGTKVWLNAKSDLQFPAAFAKNERIVQLTGEAYFEVAPNKSHPFKVLAGNAETVVLGTHFNVNAYNEEEQAVISLLEGSVKTAYKGSDMVLLPNEEVVLEKEMIQKRKISDSSSVVGWKNGFFEFHDASIKQIMSQVSRWYGVKINYQYNNEHLFNASIERSVPLSKLLKYLQLTNKVHFKLENKTITVMN